MAERVGKVHVHELPYNRDLPVMEDVYACYCKKEFMVQAKTETRFGKDNKEWVEVGGDISIEYDRTVNGQTFIGRAGPDTVFDKPGGSDEEATGGEDSPSGDGTSTASTAV